MIPKTFLKHILMVDLLAYAHVILLYRYRHVTPVKSFPKTRTLISVTYTDIIFLDCCQGDAVCSIIVETVMLPITELRNPGFGFLYGQGKKKGR